MALGRAGLLWMATLSTVALLVIWSLSEAPTLLSRWQSDFGYRLVTGSLLATLIGFQWALALLRVRGFSKLAKRFYAWHHVGGALGPVLLAFHSARMGFGFLALLCGVFVANTVLGLVSPSMVPKLREYSVPWFVSHVALSVLLVSLAGYHAWTAVYFE
jgi:hypothetical protein